MNIVIVGATSLIAEHCARIWVLREGVRLVLVGRNEAKLARVAADLRVRNPKVEIQVETVDFFAPDAITALVERLGKVDIVLIAQGLLTDQQRCQTELDVTRDVLEVNAVSPVLFAEAFALHMAKKGSGKIALLGSVAGDKARQANYTYGAAKALVERIAQGMQYRFAKTDIKIILIKPGPTDTPMVAHLKAKGMPVAPVEKVAKLCVKAIDKGVRVAYVPGVWRFIMLVVRQLPFWVMRSFF